MCRCRKKKKNVYKNINVMVIQKFAVSVRVLGRWEPMDDFIVQRSNELLLVRSEKWLCVKIYRNVQQYSVIINWLTLFQTIDQKKKIFLKKVIQQHNTHECEMKANVNGNVLSGWKN